MVLFTVKRGGLSSRAQAAPGLPRDVTFALYLNVLAIIVLNEPAERFSSRTSEEAPQVFITKTETASGAFQVIKSPKVSKVSCHFGGTLKGPKVNTSRYLTFNVLVTSDHF